MPPVTAAVAAIADTPGEFSSIITITITVTTIITVVTITTLIIRNSFISITTIKTITTMITIIERGSVAIFSILSHPRAQEGFCHVQGNTYVKNSARVGDYQDAQNYPHPQVHPAGDSFVALT